MSEAQGTPAPGSLQADAAGFAALGQALAAPAAPAQQPNVNVETGEAAPAFTPDQQGAFAEIETLRAELMDPARDRSQDGAKMEKLVETQKFAFGHGDRPSWMPGAQSDPRLTDQSEHDPLAQSFEGALRNEMSSDQAEQFRAGAVVRGLAPDAAETLTNITVGLGMPPTVAKQLLERALMHGTEFGKAPLTGDELFQPLDAAGAREYALEASRIMGGQERFAALATEVRSLLQQRGLLKGWDEYGLTKCSMAFDPRVLGAIRLWLLTKK